MKFWTLQAGIFNREFNFHEFMNHFVFTVKKSRTLFWEKYEKSKKWKKKCMNSVGGFFIWKSSPIPSLGCKTGQSRTKFCLVPFKTCEQPKYDLRNLNMRKTVNWSGQANWHHHISHSHIYREGGSLERRVNSDVCISSSIRCYSSTNTIFWCDLKI